MKTCPTCNQTLMPDKLELAGVAAAAEMARLWTLDIKDHKISAPDSEDKRADLNVISMIIRENGWSWALPYRGDGEPQWCGMTAGFAWLRAGLDPSWLKDYFASCYRLRLWAQYKKFSNKSKPNPEPPDDLTDSKIRLCVDLRRAERLCVVAPRPGDIVVVGDGEPASGDHVTICMSYKDGVFDTISGNGGGRGPKGDVREGISRRGYTLGQTGYRPLWLIRPAIGDLL